MTRPQTIFEKEYREFFANRERFDTYDEALEELMSSCGWQSGLSSGITLPRSFMS